MANFKIGRINHLTPVYYRCALGLEIEPMAEPLAPRYRGINYPAVGTATHGFGFLFTAFIFPNYAPGQWLSQLFDGPLVFSFTGLVFASVIYSLPFMVQPLLAAFNANGQRLTQAAAALGIAPWVALLKVLLPASRAAIVSACALTFAHTLGEFGVVLMIGGAIPGETQVVSIALYQHVEAMEYGAAHRLALMLMGITTVLLLAARWLGHSLAPRGSNSERVKPVMGVLG
ncbi:ABC transporter permease subunit [Microbulbifer sp. MLAF003]|uniref:molybdate ABC transporter permease subunit n=1 Tax=Microbulbifer sp. MLAF003 TaxID=3032582 RepID=UPI00333F2DC7